MRSKIIHGRWQRDPHIDAVMADTEGIVRTVFRRLLENPEMLRTFISKSRNQFLEDCGCFPAALIRHHTRPQSDWTGPDLNFSRRRSSTVRAARAATVCRVRPKSCLRFIAFRITQSAALCIMKAVPRLPTTAVASIAESMNESITLTSRQAALGFLWGIERRSEGDDAISGKRPVT